MYHLKEQALAATLVDVFSLGDSAKAALLGWREKGKGVFSETCAQARRLDRSPPPRSFAWHLRFILVRQVLSDTKVLLTEPGSTPLSVETARAASVRHARRRRREGAPQT